MCNGLSLEAQGEENKEEKEEEEEKELSPHMAPRPARDPMQHRGLGCSSAMHRETSFVVFPSPKRKQKKKKPTSP